MTARIGATLGAIAMTGLLAGCGGGGIAGGKSADWAVDACKTFPVDAARKASGVAVAKAEPAGQVSTGDVLVSNCTYTSGDGNTNFGIVLRQSKTGDRGVDTLIAEMKSRPDMTGPSEDVAMPTGKAIWATRLHTLSYVPADGRMIVVTPPDAVVFGRKGPPEAELKAKAIAIARAIEG